MGQKHLKSNKNPGIAEFVLLDPHTAQPEGKNNVFKVH